MAKNASGSATRRTTEQETSPSFHWSPASSDTAPPKASTATTIRRTASPTTLVKSSGSSRSASAVEPTTSANRAVTTFRASRVAGGARPIACPHAGQKRAPSSSGSPQASQRAMSSAAPHCAQ